MKICGLQKLTLLDFPGQTACTVFTSGCNFRCPFCHNASLARGEAEILDEDYIFSFLKKRAQILDGICITGGEPLLSPDIADFIRRARSLGYKIKLDTNGSFPDRLSALIDEGLIDYVAMDIKSSPEGYLKAAGLNSFDISKIDASIKLLLSGKVPYEFRTTVAKGLHEEEDFVKIAKWISGADAYYLQNYRESEDAFLKDGLAPFSEDELNSFKKTLESAGLTVFLRGI